MVMRMRSLLLLVPLTLVVPACGGGDDSQFPDGGDPNGNDAGLGLPDGFGLGDGGGGDGGLDPDAACAASIQSAAKPQVDIIVVIDTSGSMTEEVVQTKTNINDFATSIGQSGLDYQVILIAARGTGNLQMCVPPPLGGANCADNPPLFHHVNQTVGSTNSLSLVLSTYDSANAALNWAKYLRPTATKVFIEITDDNSSLAFASFDTQLLAKQPAGMFGTAQKRKYIFDSICGWSDPSPILDPMKCGSAVNIGANYQNLSVLTKGIVDSVCKTSYKGVFQNIAKGVAGTLGCQFDMPKSNGNPIDPNKVVVRYTPGSGPAQSLTQVTDASKCAQFPNGWYYDNNTTPTKILLCAGACTTVGADQGGKVEILVGCATDPPK
jgi:hypothetical protein